MKNLITLLLILTCSISYSQETTKENKSFLTKNQPVELFSTTNTSGIKNAFRLKLPSTDESSQMYSSDFMSFMYNDSRLMNYPARDMRGHNNVTFGTYSNTTLNLGNTKMQTFYFFDHTGRLVDTTTSLIFGK